LLKQLGRARYEELLARQQELLREAFAARGGVEIDTQGDSPATDSAKAAASLSCQMTTAVVPELFAALRGLPLAGHFQRLLAESCLIGIEQSLVSTLLCFRDDL
jgi:hypothetical protein